MSRLVRSASAWNKASARSSSSPVTEKTYNQSVVCCQAPVAVPSRPTFKPAAGPARFGSGAWAAGTSAPTLLPAGAAGHLDTLLRDRERIRAATELDDWARAEATRTAGVDRSFLYRHHDLRSQILTLAAEPEPNPPSTRTSHHSLLADLANLREHNERLRHHNTKLSERLSEVLGEQVFHDAGLTRTDEIGTLRERVAQLEQQLLDRRQDLQDRDDELAAARAANRDLMTRLNSRL
jgi:hypothetical protein